MQTQLYFQVPASPEDNSLIKGKPILKSHDDVDRVRR